MANSERDYDPRVDNLRAFDLKMDMDSADDPSRLPLLVIMALVVLAAFAGVVWLAYTQGVERGRASVSRELTASEVWKIRKSNVPPYTGLKIYEQATGSQPSTAPAASPPKAASAIPPLRPSAGIISEPSEPSSTPAKEVTRHAASGISSPRQSVAKQGANAAATRAQQTAAAATAAALNKAAMPAMPTHPLTLPDSAPALAAPGTSAPGTSAPTSHPAATSTSISTTAPVHSPTPAAATARTESAGVVLQIGSYKSEAEARRSWEAFKAEHSAAIRYQADVKAVDLGARGTWYRLRMGTFPDKKSAIAACAKLKADGASCLLAQ